VQDAAQAFHFNNNHCTVITVLYYYHCNEKLLHGSMVILSNCLSHDTVAVHISQKLIINELKNTCTIKKIIYFTDGAKQHFKNQFQICNLLHHTRILGCQQNGISTLLLMEKEVVME